LRSASLVADGRINVLNPCDLSRLLKRSLVLQAYDAPINNPTVAQLMVAVDKMDHCENDVLIVLDNAWDNAYVQACIETNRLFWVEYRDGATQFHYRAKRQVLPETFKLILLSYLYHGDSLMKHAVIWEDVTATL
jgi:hypothetical protein